MRLIILALLAIAAPTAARDLPVPATKGWQHAATGLILMPTLDGLPRTKLGDLTATEHDVFAEFASPGLADVVTIYLFHPAVDDVAMWFERSEAALYNRKNYGDVAPASADPIPFAPPGSATANGLRRVYAPAKGPVRATGLAVMPLGEWLVAIRISSTAENAAALDARLTRVIAALRWPAGAASGPTLSPIVACPAPLAFDRKAKPVKPGGSDLILSLLGASIARTAAAKGEKPDPARWCRDPSSTAAYGVYRNSLHDVGYTIALQDAGRVIHVVPSLDAQMGKGSTHSVTLTSVDGTTTTFPSFDRLPAPEQVVDSLARPALGSSQGNTVRIDAGAIK